jgi:hydroxymethylpyrimidine pyrophosphatase-like HAD family hydrolase/fructoselysine-6-P-deglycase FrlB-like protein
MGKPFSSELANIKGTMEWCAETSVDVLEKFVNQSEQNFMLAVGSGGSLSACYLVALLHQDRSGYPCKAITPLELFNSSKVISKSSLLFISASGKNNDILSAFKLAGLNEPKHLLAFSFKKKSPLELLAKDFSGAMIVDYDIPTGKDGFLATNTLIAYFILLSKAFGNILNVHTLSLLKRRSDEYNPEIHIEDTTLSKKTEFVVLFGGWGQPVAIDLESKFSEAALGNLQYADYRNFGHGRHHWFAKRSETSVIVALVTPAEKLIATKTLALLPEDVTKIILSTEISGCYGTIDLLIQAFHLVQRVGKVRNIDPGKPGVPEFGSHLYRLKLSSFYLKKVKEDYNISRIAVQRKLHSNGIVNLTHSLETEWNASLKEFIVRLNKSEFGAFALDYDGTLCTGEERFRGMSEKVIPYIIKAVSENIMLAVITGRGKSIKEVLRSIIPKESWPKILVGYYNGGEIGFLDDDSSPDTTGRIHSSLKKVSEILENSCQNTLEISLRPCQLTISPINKNNWPDLRGLIQDKIINLGCTDINILESSHSVDIIPHTISKQAVLKVLEKHLKERNLPSDILCIGDRGKWPGNDYLLLSTPYSLSVNEVSSDKNTCWNLAKAGIYGPDAIIKYFDRVKYLKAGFKINIII